MTNIEELKVINNSIELSSGVYFLNADNLALNSLNINAISNSNISLFIEFNNKDIDMDFDVEDNTILNIGIINTTTSKNSTIHGQIKQNSTILLNIADFSNDKTSFTFTGDLVETNSSCNVHVATVSANDDNKLFSININHLTNSTSGKVECYGVSKNKSKLIFAGTSYIQNGAIKSKTNQTAKAMIFDETSIAIAKPILKIDENDVEASHGAAIGKINDEHLFYLTSRGLSEEQAKQIITLGYLKPIINKFDDSLKAKIESLIERSL